MTELPLRHPEAQLLADLAIAHANVHHAHELILPLCTATYGHLTAEEEEMRWTTAVFQYMRVFPYGGGVLRWGAESALSSLDARDQATHQHTWDVRRGYLAHSVGGYEDATPFVKAEGTGADWRVVCVGTRHGRLAAPSSTDADNFARLTLNLGAVIDARYKAESDRLFKVAQALGESYFANAPPGPNVTLGKPEKPREASAERGADESEPNGRTVESSKREVCYVVGHDRFGHFVNQRRD